HGCHSAVSMPFWTWLSSRHSKRGPPSELANEKTDTGVPIVDPSAGPATIVVSGGSASSVEVRRAGGGSGVPSGGAAREGCGAGAWPASADVPAAGAGAVHGGVQGVNAGTDEPAPSMRHSNVAPGVSLE